MHFRIETNTFMHYHLHCTACCTPPLKLLFVSPPCPVCIFLHNFAHFAHEHCSGSYLCAMPVSPAHCLETLSLILLSILCNASSSSASIVPDFLFACLFSSLRICALYWTPTTPSEKFLHILFVLVHFTTNTNHTPQSSCSQNQMTLAKLKGVTFSGTMIFYICLPFPT